MTTREDFEKLVEQQLINAWHDGASEYGNNFDFSAAQNEIVSSCAAHYEAVIAMYEAAKLYDEAPDDAEFEPPHPIFQLAQERDNFMFRVKELEQQLEVARKDAERYQWLRAGNAMEPEDNGIYGYERLDEFCDAAIRQIGGAE